MSPWHTYEQVRIRLGVGTESFTVGLVNDSFDAESEPVIRFEWRPGVGPIIRYDLTPERFQRSDWGLADAIAHDMQAEWQRQNLDAAIARKYRLI